MVEAGMLFGFLGLLLCRRDYPVAPMAVGLILRPMAKAQFRRALQLSIVGPLVFLESPGSATLQSLAAIVLRGLSQLKTADD